MQRRENSLEALIQNSIQSSILTELSERNKINHITSKYNLVFYAQPTITVMSGRDHITREKKCDSLFMKYTIKMTSSKEYHLILEENKEGNPLNLRREDNVRGALDLAVCKALTN